MPMVARSTNCVVARLFLFLSFVNAAPIPLTALPYGTCSIIRVLVLVQVKMRSLARATITSIPSSPFLLQRSI